MFQVEKLKPLTRDAALTFISETVTPSPDHCLKVVSTTFLVVCFLRLKESTCETMKNIFFISLRKLFSFLR